MTTDQTDPRPNGHAAEPLALRLNDQLGLEERAKLDALLDHIHEYGTTAEGVLLRAAQLCQAARAAERERLCAAIKAEDDYCVTDGDYMLDSDDCIRVIRGTWTRPDYSLKA